MIISPNKSTYMKTQSKAANTASVRFNHAAALSFLLWLALAFGTTECRAAFPTGSGVCVVAETASAAADTVAKQGTHTKRGKGLPSFREGAMGYLSVGFAFVGLCFFSLQTTLIMLICGLGATILGKIGIKQYKHQKLLRALCYVGIVIGFLLVLFATVPILFLV